MKRGIGPPLGPNACTGTAGTRTHGWAALRIGSGSVDGHGLAALCAKARDGVLLADGGTGTALQAQGLPRGSCPEEWNLSHPDRVAAVAAACVAAGSELVYANTFGGNRLVLERHGLSQHLAEVNASAVAAARAGAGTGVWVAGDIGPSGQLLEPLGDLSPAAAGACFYEQTAALVAAGVDLLVLETFTQLTEALAALEAARSVTAIPIVVSLSFDRGARTVMGVAPVAAAEVLLAAGADVLGANCGGAWEDAAEALRGYARATPGTPLLLKPNAGLPQVGPQGDVYPGDPDAFARFVGSMVNQVPLCIVGGCCGTGPGHIAALRRTLRHGGVGRAGQARESHLQPPTDSGREPLDSSGSPEPHDEPR